MANGKRTSPCKIWVQWAELTDSIYILKLTLATPNLMVDKIPKFLAHSLKLELSLPLKSLHLKSFAEVTLRSVLNTL